MCPYLFDIIHISLVPGELLYEYKATRRLIGRFATDRMEFYSANEDGVIVGFTNPDKDYIGREMIVFRERGFSPLSEDDLYSPDMGELSQAAERFFEVHDEIVPLQELRDRLIT